MELRPGSAGTAALPVVAGAENYLSWLQANLRGAEE
jgi:hypothetical protein